MNTDEGDEKKISRKCIREVQLYLRYEEINGIMKSFRKLFKIVLHDGSQLVSGNIHLIDLQHQIGRNNCILPRQYQYAPGSLDLWELHLSEKHQRCDLQSDEPDNSIIQYVINITDNPNILTNDNTFMYVCYNFCSIYVEGVPK